MKVILIFAFIISYLLGDFLIDKYKNVYQWAKMAYAGKKKAKEELELVFLAIDWVIILFIILHILWV